MTTTSGPHGDAPGLREPVAARRSGARSVYDVLRTQIIDGALAPDARLTEPVLAGRLGVSRTPVREALRQLEAEGLVVQQPTGGVRVAPLDAAQARRVYELRLRLEGLVARRAAENVRAGEAADDDTARLVRLVDVMDAVRDHDDEVLRVGAEFHALVERLAADPLCAALLRQIRGHVDRYRALAARERVGTTAHVEEHRAVAVAVAAGDPDAAEDAMRAHLGSSADHAARGLAEHVP